MFTDIWLLVWPFSLLSPCPRTLADARINVKISTRPQHKWMITSSYGVQAQGIKLGPAQVHRVWYQYKHTVSGTERRVDLEPVSLYPNSRL